MKMHISGLRELDRALSDLTKATARNVLRRVGNGALQPMAEAAQGAAPKASGDLEISIVVSSKRTRRAGGTAAERRLARQNGYTVAMGPASGKGVLNYATFVEFGTVDTPAQPYMRPAWAQGKDAALDYVISNLRIEIDKASARAARRAAKKAKTS